MWLLCKKGKCNTSSLHCINASLTQPQSTQFHMLMPFFSTQESILKYTFAEDENLFFSFQLEEFHHKKQTVILAYFGYLSFMPHFCIIEHEGVPMAVSHSIE